jgi:hypothetical protein
VGLAIAAGFSNLRLARQLQVAQAQLAEQATQIAHLQAQPTATAAPLVLASDSDLMAGNWHRIAPIFDDHTLSMQMENYKIMVPSAQPREIFQALQPAVALPPQVHALTTADAALMGGNACFFEDAEGARFVYQIGEDMASFYQITSQNGMGLTATADSPIYVTRPGGESAVFWQEGDLVYAIVGNFAPDQ